MTTNKETKMKKTEFSKIDDGVYGVCERITGDS